MLKRSFDLVAASTAFLLLSPALIVIAVAVAVMLGKPVLFRQRRPGLHGAPFHILKFRTMTSERDGDGQLLPDARRLTGFGRLLRATSVDELPALWNVIVGQMSLVGPRPLLEQYLPLYTAEQARRHEVRPGLTGWAQINGRNLVSWEEKFAMDVWYVDNRSFLLDLKILLRTVKQVAVRHGISAPREATMTAFTGSAARPEPGQGSGGVVDVARRRDGTDNLGRG